MASKTDICNMALMDIGVSETIADVDTESSKAARVCRSYYNATRDHALQEFPWAFATRRVVLAQLSSAPATNWGYAYRYPSDCIQTRGIVVPGVVKPRATQRIPYEVASDETGKVIFCDLEDAELIYTARIEDTTLFDPMFVTALAALLASRIAMPMAVKPEIMQAARQAYLSLINNAAARSMSDSNPGVEPESEFLAVRELGMSPYGGGFPLNG